MTRRLRGIRSPNSRVVVGERDLQLLELIGLVRWASMAHLSLFFPNGSDRAMRRCRQLFDAGLIRIVVIGSAEPSWVALTRAGLDLVERHRGEIDLALAVPGPLSIATIRHHSALVWSRLWASSLREVGRPPLLHWSSGKSEAARAALGGAALVPDGYAELGLSGDRVLEVFIEADTGSQRRAVIEAKCERYAPVIAAGQHRELWFVTTGGEARAELLSEVVFAAGLAARTRVLSETDLRTRPVIVPAKVDGTGGVRPHSRNPAR